MSYIIRRSLEKEIVKRLLDKCDALNYTYFVDGESERGRLDVEALLLNLDDAHLIIKGPNLKGWVRLVFGNDGFDLICDYTTSLEKFLDHINHFTSNWESYVTELEFSCQPTTTR